MRLTIIPRLSYYQWLGLVLLSLNFWYSGVVLVSNINYYFGWNLMTFGLLCVLSYPIAVISIRGVDWILQLTPAQSQRVITIITVIVSTIHLIALYALTDWYQISGAGLILAIVWLGIFSITVLITSLKRHTSN